MASDNPAAAQELAALTPEHLMTHAVAAGYVPIGAEIDPRPAMRRLAAAGARLALPVVRAGRLEFRAWRDGDPLAADALGIPSPSPASGRLRPDLVLVPLLAFDRRGGRLGQGGGYFDRAIADLRSQGPLMVVGCAFAGQEVDDVPMAAHDARLDGVLTERGYLDFT